MQPKSAIARLYNAVSELQRLGARTLIPFPDHELRAAVREYHDACRPDLISALLELGELARLRCKEEPGELGKACRKLELFEDLEAFKGPQG